MNLLVSGMPSSYTMHVSKPTSICRDKLESTTSCHCKLTHRYHRIAQNPWEKFISIFFFYANWTRDPCVSGDGHSVFGMGAEFTETHFSCCFFFFCIAMWGYWVLREGSASRDAVDWVIKIRTEMGRAVSHFNVSMNDSEGRKERRLGRGGG